MTLRLLPPALLALCFSAFASAQTFRPLAGYEQLATPEKSAFAAEKMDCEFDATGFSVVLPGDTLTLRAGVDTAGLGAGVTYICDDCAAANFGTAVFANDTLQYGADAGAEFGLDTLTLRATNAAGDASPERTIIVLVRRAGREVTVSNLTVAPREAVEVSLASATVPGGATCRSIEPCAVGYDGRDREFSFNTDLRDGNDFRFRAAGLGGTDAICVTLCNDFGLCDVFRTNFTVQVPRTDFPFFDDFSAGGIRPRAALWQDTDVLINRNFAVAPPSIGVATFDGVDFSGQSYPQGSGGRRTAIRDYLTSAPVNLSGRSGVELDFYLQPRGLGNRPETQDSFLVQFLDAAGNWTTVFSRPGLLTTSGNNEIPPFVRTRIALSPEHYHADFQFRFANRSSEQGAVDMWHLDYVRLDDVDNSPADLALREPPGYVLKDYTGIPLRHFRAGGVNLLNDSITLRLQNLADAPTAVVTLEGPSSLVTVRSSQTGTLLDASVGLLSPFAFGTGQAGENSFDPGESIFRTTDLLDLGNLTTQLIPYLTTLAALDSPFGISTTYVLDAENEAGSAYAPSVTDNNTATTVTDFRNYMAYDDGTAELTLEGAPGTIILQEYDAFTSDVLLGLSIRLPRLTGSLGNQPLRLVVYSGADRPDFEELRQDFAILYPEDFYEDSLLTFTTYYFDEALELPEGPFYVGWEQTTASRNIGVGFDRNTAPQDRLWFDNGDGFFPLAGSTSGALMIRPLLAGFDGTPTSTTDPSEDALIDVFPNPTTGQVQVRTRATTTGPLDYRLFSLTGALLSAGRLSQRLDLGDLPAGVYVLEVTDGNHRSRLRLVRQ